MEPTTATIDAIRKASERKALKEMMDMRVELNARKAQIEEDLKSCNEMILATLKKHNYKSMVFEDQTGQGWTFTVMNGCNTSIDKKALLNKGIDPELIEQCTKRTEYTTITARKHRPQIELGGLT